MHPQISKSQAFESGRNQEHHDKTREISQLNCKQAKCGSTSSSQEDSLGFPLYFSGTKQRVKKKFSLKEKL